MDLEGKLKAYKEQNSVKVREGHVLDTICKSQEVFFRKEQERLLTYWEFLWSQFRLVQKKWWVFQIILLIFVYTTLQEMSDTYFFRRGMGIAGVLFVILIIPELWKNKSCQCMEIEGAAYYSLRQIYAARIMLFGMMDLLMLTVFCMTVHECMHIAAVDFIVQFLLPMAGAACICFGLLCSRYAVSEGVSIVLCVVWSAVWCLVTANEEVYQAVELPVWAALLVAAAVFIAAAGYRAIHRCNLYWEYLNDEMDAV